MELGSTKGLEHRFTSHVCAGLKFPSYIQVSFHIRDLKLWPEESLLAAGNKKTSKGFFEGRVPSTLADGIGRFQDVGTVLRLVRVKPKATMKVSLSDSPCAEKR